MSGQRHWARRILSNGLVQLGILVAAMFGAMSVTVSAPPPIPAVQLSSEPLYARGARSKPTLTLALSVEFPTVGAQYTPGGSDDATYSPATQYVGYYDTESCYTYNNHVSDSLKRYFTRTGAATNRTCGGAGFSGNFMNWASSSAIDILRFGLTGGDRVIDEETSGGITVLQRAVLPTNFYNSSNFPSKRLVASLVAGAVPDNLHPSYNGDIYIANCLNRVHFGTQKEGDCGTPGHNSDLGTPTGASITSTGIYNGALPADFVAFASEAYPGLGGTYLISGTKQIVYGSGTTWAVKTQTGGNVYCSNDGWATYGIPGLAASGDPTPSVAKQCFQRTPPAAGASGGLTSDQFFYSRVAVCQSDSSFTLLDQRPDLCRRYPASAFKPVGNLQKYSDVIRVATFGYLNDNTGNPNERYGGVLRSPMKYVGAKSFDANFNQQAGTNPLQEWKPDTGAFIVNPDGASGITTGTGSTPPSTTVSGTINYLNQFGRTGTPGQYKTYDPVGELYYEALRYVQGLPPTPAATDGMTDPMKDGFPVYTSWIDPHPAVAGMTDYSCVKNNIVAIGDVNTHNDKTIPGNNRLNNDVARGWSDAANEPDFTFWTRVVGGFESNTEVPYPPGDGSADVSSKNISINAPYNPARWEMETQNIGADGASYYIAGMAYWANTHDIRGTQWTDTAKQRKGMRLRTYILDVNEYGAQNNDNVRRTANQFFLASKYGGFNDVEGKGNPFRQYQSNSSNIIDGNASWNKGPSDPDKYEAKNYFLSSSAQGVLVALNDIFANIAKEARSIAGGAVSATSLDVGDSGFVYQAQFNPAEWSGDVVPYAITLTGGGLTIDSESANAPWTAAARLEAKAALDVLSGYDNSVRKIFIGNPDANPSTTAYAFNWSSMNSTLQTYLSYAPNSSTLPTPIVDTPAQGQARLAYLRGDRSREGTSLRKRQYVLGDIINSGVAFVAAPPKTNSDPGYSTHAATYASRTKALYVGANDGMLHAFSSADGQELFAYIPSWIAPRLTDLTAPGYVHASFVDATPVIAEAKVGTAWKTVLVGGTGGGGQGVYGLDVTDPSAFDATKVLWEFTDRDDPRMGNVVGKTQILKFRTSSKTAQPATYKYFAVVPGGVNNYVDDGHFNASGDASLFILDLSKAPGAAWSLNNNYYRVDLPKSVTTMAQGVINFSARMGPADEVQQIYVGDLQGNMWKLNFADFAADSHWSTLADLSPYGAAPLFVAPDGTNRQPISAGPALINSAQYKLIVAFGTGKYLEVGDTSKPYSTQSAYAILDDGTTSPLADGRNLLQQIATTSTATTAVNFRWGRPGSPGDTSVRAGWYFDLPGSSSGERQITNFAVADGTLIGSTVIPAVNTCDTGSGNIYAIKIFTGGGTITASTVGIPSEPSPLNLSTAIFQGPDSTGVRRLRRSTTVIITGSNGVSAPSTPLNEVRYGRLSWRLININK